MPVTMQGTVPYPPMAEARPIIELATQLRELGQLFAQQSGQIRQTASTATSTWTGQGANTFVQTMTGRADTVSDVGRLLGQAATPLQAFAAAITATQAAYSTAAVAERAAQAGLPWTAGALAAAIAAETGAVSAHQAAGFACAGALGGIVAQIAIKEFFGGRRNGSGTTPAGDTTSGDRGDGQGIIDTVFDWILGEDEQPATTPTNGLTDQVPAAQPDTTTIPVFPPGTTEAQRFDRYAGYFRASGVDITTLPEGERAILGLRSPSSTIVNNGQGEFNDRVVVAWTENGVRRVEEFNANTEPSAQYDGELRGTVQNGQRIGRRSINGGDGDLDGDLDLGRLPTGNYDFEWTRNSSVPGASGGVLRRTAPVQLERDVNHDGTFDQADRDAMERAVQGRTAQQTEALRLRQQQALSDGNTIRFHPGSDNNTFSAGCQTFPGGTDGAEWRRFRDTALGGYGNQDRFTYVLRDVTPAVPANPQPRR